MPNEFIPLRHSLPPTTVCLSPQRLRDMATDLLHLANLLDSLDKRELAYRVDGGLVMSTRQDPESRRKTFSVHGTLDVHVPVHTLEASRG